MIIFDVLVYLLFGLCTMIAVAVCIGERIDELEADHILPAMLGVVFWPIVLVCLALYLAHKHIVKLINYLIDVRNANRNL
jgi:hypothetical protein